MKKSNVVSVRLDNKEIEALEIYSKIFNTDKTSTIIKKLLTANPYIDILKNIVKNLDDKEYKLTSLKFDFRNDSSFIEAIDKKIECIDSFRTDILSEIDTQITSLSLVHSLIPKEGIDPDGYVDEVLGDCNNTDPIIDSFFEKILNESDDPLEGLEGEDLDKAVEEQLIEFEKENEIEKNEMKNRARLFLKYF